MNSVSRETRSISSRKDEISSWIASTSSCVFVWFAAWTDSSRILWSILCTSESAPSAVSRTEVPSIAFRFACSKPRICARSFVAIAIPAASSDARLIRSPVDSRSMEPDRLLSFRSKFLLAIIDDIL